MALLRKVAPELSEPDADRVAAAVGDLPLAVEQAGAMVRDAGLGVEVYLRLLRERAGELLAHDGGATYPVSVAASWAVAFDRLAADDPAALDLLTLVAWCGPEPVPLDLLTDHPAVLPDPLAITVSDPLALGRCTGVVHRRAMATLTAHSIQVHRVPAALLRARTRDQHRDLGGWAAVVVRLLCRALPGDVWDNPVVWPRWQQLVPHVLAAVDPDRRLDDVPDELSWLLDRAASYQRTFGQAGAALPLFQRALATRRDRLGTTTPTPSPRPTTSPRTCLRWASTSRPATWTRTPSPATGGCSATTIPTPSPRPTTSASTCAPWASTSRPTRWETRLHHRAPDRRTGSAPSDRQLCAQAHPAFLTFRTSVEGRRSVGRRMRSCRAGTRCRRSPVRRPRTGLRQSARAERARPAPAACGALDSYT